MKWISRIGEYKHAWITCPCHYIIGTYVQSTLGTRLSTNMPIVGSKLKLCTEMKPADLCTSTPVQHRYIESCSATLV